MKCTEYNELTLVSDVYVGVSRADGVRNDNCDELPSSQLNEAAGKQMRIPSPSTGREGGQLSFLTPSARETPT